MKRITLLLFLSFLCINYTSAQQSPPANNQNDEIEIPDEYILLVNNQYFTPLIHSRNIAQLDTREKRANALKRKNANFLKKLSRDFVQMGLDKTNIIRVSTGAKNYAHVKIPAHLLEKLKSFKYIIKLVPDTKVHIDLPEFQSLTLNTQTPDWGIDVVGAGTTSGVGKCAFVVDTGVFGDHPDLTVNKSLSTSFIPTEKSFKDLKGHGTHVAGIIGAIDNNIGVKGVAAGATIIAVKVLDKNGQQQGSSILFGADYVAGIGMAGDVVNFSLGWPGTDIVLENCIKNDIAAHSIYVAIAAGNKDWPADQTTPARVNGLNIYTVSNMDINRNISPTSNYGNGPVDFAAPGSKIYSTDIKKNGLYSTKSGTSMAAPYVAGILLVNNGVVNSNGVLNTDKDNILDPVASVQ